MFKVGDWISNNEDSDSKSIEEHFVCLKVLVGSHNYNLNTPDSDRDYKYFVYPTFDDLYEGKKYHKEVTTETEDYTIHDIRQLPMLLWKSNLNFLEILFSKEFSATDEIELIIKNDHTNDLATMNIPKIYSAGLGMFNNKINQMNKLSPGRKENIEKFGYDTKSACHAVRILTFVERVREYNLDIKKALWYEDDDSTRKLLIDIKMGKYTYDEVVDIISHHFDKVKDPKMKEWYESHKKKEDMYNKIEYKLKDIILHRYI